MNLGTADNTHWWNQNRLGHASCCFVRQFISIRPPPYPRSLQSNRERISWNLALCSVLHHEQELSIVRFEADAIRVKENRSGRCQSHLKGRERPVRALPEPAAPHHRRVGERKLRDPLWEVERSPGE